MKNIEDLKKLALNIKLLYVEDDKTAREKMTKILKRIFPHIDVATNGQEGLLLYMKEKHNLIISDINMNIMDGLEMSRIIKEVNSKQRIILVSAYGDQKFLTSAIELGVDGFVFKPLDTEKFYKVLEKILKQIALSIENKVYKENLESLVEKRTADLIEKNEELKRMIEEVKKARILKEEMKVAQSVQENFLPKKVLQTETMSVATFFEAAQYVGGDYYDLFYSNDESINIIIADVSGHGIVPAITMSTFRGVCRSIFALSLPFEQQLWLINNLMCEDASHSDFFITAFFIKYYEKENKFEYISTGHNEMILYNDKEDTFEDLKATAIPLGIFSNTKYEVISKEVSSKDFILLYTDGLIEAMNKDKEMYDIKRLRDVLEESKKLSSQEILENIKKSLNTFIENVDKADDTTVLSIKFT